MIPLTVSFQVQRPVVRMNGVVIGPLVAFGIAAAGDGAHHAATDPVGEFQAARQVFQILLAHALVGVKNVAVAADLEDLHVVFLEGAAQFGDHRLSSVLPHLQPGHRGRETLAPERFDSVADAPELLLAGRQSDRNQVACEAYWRRAGLQVTDQVLVRAGFPERGSARLAGLPAAALSVGDSCGPAHGEDLTSSDSVEHIHLQ